MPNKVIELPRRVAQAFVRDMRAFFKAKNQLKQDEIASRQLHALAAFQRPRDKKLRLADVGECRPSALPGVPPIVILMAATETQINHLRTIRFPSRTVSFRSRD
jgi:hypothetical protein